MALQVTSKDFEVTEALAQHAEKAFAKLAKAKVETTNELLHLKKDGSVFVAELEVRTPLADFFAKAEDHDCYKAITEVVNKVYEQARKKLEKVQH